MIKTSKYQNFFNANWVFFRSVPTIKFLPLEGPPEIAFAGRSNVGKSSLINALVGQNSLAWTSNTPGRTQVLNFFIPDGYGDSVDSMPPLMLVDMPGYGFAEASKTKIHAWTKLVFDYLCGRSTLKRVYLLIDARHGIKKSDITVFDLLDKFAISYQLVLTKADKIKKGDREVLRDATLQTLSRKTAAYPQILITSSEKKEGLDDLRTAIALLL